MPPTAIGKDYPYRGDWYGLTASRTGVFASLGGYLGLTIGWIEGIELNFFGGVLGLDIRRPALKLPGVGRLGLPACFSDPIGIQPRLGPIRFTTGTGHRVATERPCASPSSSFATLVSSLSPCRGLRHDLLRKPRKRTDCELPHMQIKLLAVSNGLQRGNHELPQFRN